MTVGKRLVNCRAFLKYTPQTYTNARNADTIQIKFDIIGTLVWLLEYSRGTLQVRLPGQESLHAVFLLSGVHILN